jgi:acyl-CoA thioester hydrolase
MIPPYICRVYFDDTDAGGVVYHANYLKMCERARSEQLKSLGFDHFDSFNTNKGFFVVFKCELTCKKPARLGDELIVNTMIKSIHGSSLNIGQMISLNGTNIAEVSVLLVWVDDQQKAKRIPDSVRTILNNFIQ